MDVADKLVSKNRDCDLGALVVELKKWNIQKYKKLSNQKHDPALI
jgi:hypothetical protein